MIRSMYTSVSAMINLEKKQSIVTNNIANINTSGYKSEQLISKSFGEIKLIDSNRYTDKGANYNIGSLNPGVKIDEIYTDYGQGNLIKTDNKTDFAIEGNGFFEVEDLNGNKFYTRDGVFRINEQGYLVTSAGYYVTGNNTSNDATERIYVGNSKLLLNKDNELNIQGQGTFKFNIVEFENLKNLINVGENVYKGEGALESLNSIARQGYKEGSNVDIIDQQNQLIANLREFEANQKITQSVDSILRQIASEIGTVR